MKTQNPTVSEVLTPETCTNNPASARVLAEARKTAIHEEPKRTWDDLDLFIKGGLMLAALALFFFVICLGGHR